MVIDLGGFRHPAPNLLASVSGDCRREDHRDISKNFTNHSQLHCPLVARQFVGFRSDYQPWNSKMPDPFRKLDVQRRRRHTRIHEVDDESKPRTALKVALYQMFPLFASASSLGIAKSRQVNKEEGVAVTVKINAPSLARRRTGSSQALHSHEPIDQA